MYKSKEQFFANKLQLVVFSPLTIVCLLANSIQSAHANGQQTADGIHLDVAAGEYSTVGDAEHALHALNAGSIETSDVDIKTEGFYALGVLAAGSGSQVTFQGGTINTSGDIAHGISAIDGGNINAENVLIHTMGDRGRGVQVDTGSLVKLSNSSIITEGGVSAGNSTAGVNAANGGTALVSNSSILSKGDNALGILATGAGSVIEMIGGTVTTTGSKSDAVLALGGANTIVLQDVNIITTFGGSRGVIARGVLDGVASKVNIKGGSITTTGKDAFGILTGDRGAVEGIGIVVNTSGESGHGVLVARDGEVNLFGSAISTIGTGAKGVYVSGYGSANVSSGSSIHTSGDQASAVHVDKGSLGLSTSTILSEGNRVEDVSSAGLLASNGGRIFVRHSDIKTTGYWGDGVNAESNGSLIEMLGGSILTTGKDSKGAVAHGGNGTVNLTDVDLRTEGETARGVVASGIKDGIVSSVNLKDSVVTTVGKGSFGIQAIDSGVVNATNSNVLTIGEYATGISVLAGTAPGTTVNLKNTHVQTVGTGAWGADVKGNLNIDGGSILSLEHGALQASGDAAIALINGAQLIGGNGTLLSVSDESSKVTLSMNNQAYTVGDIVFGSKADSDGDGSLSSNTDVSMNSASYWEGKTTAVNALSLNQDSQWTVTGNSLVGQLSLDKGRIVFDSPSDDAFKSLTVTGDLNGSGMFLLNTDLSRVRGDLLKVNGQIRGEHTLVVADSGREAQGNALMLVDGNGGDGKFDLYGGKVDAGAFRYELEQRGNDWYLAGKDSPGPQDLSKGSNAAVAQHSASAALVGAQMNSLVKRLGELRMGKDNGGLWTRGFTKEQHIDTGSSRAFQQQISGFEIGADKQLPFYDGNLYIGGMVGKGESRQSFGEGSKGTIDSAMLGGYATYLDRSGVYVDSVLKYTHLNNKVEVASNLGEKVDAKFKNHAVSIDVEVGKHIDIAKGWFVEPQVELQAIRVAGANYTASNDLKVEQDGVTSIQSRLGSLFGRNMKLDNGMTLQPYAKASWITEHAGDSRVRVNDIHLSSKLPGSRAEVGGGVILLTAEKHKYYIDAEYTKGSEIEQPYSVNLGYRYTW
ncbi:autotransporter [Pseudomonas sp. Eqa60]|uniref:autotransporter outer membrane beta-barrel domain-containing protein n=1 Tax=Pseudomonas sp. Eqa60 TaxID=2799184 RepID=UPI001BB39FD0|nr:autotransporter outer membrane beta-barrel domain-containing protein [Pseudomonas sp. Eqa60]BCQ69789.1 autotransporter [Pseudomonas sp. Eqa60]